MSVQNQENLSPEGTEQNLPLNNILALLEQLTNTKPNEKFEQQAKYLANDEEIKKIKKQRQKRLNALKELNQPTQEIISALLAEIEKILKDQKKIHTDSIVKSKELDTLMKRKEKLVSDNQRMRDQFKLLDKLKMGLEDKLNDKKEEYNKLVEEEGKKKQDLINSFQDEIREIQTAVEQKCRLRAEKAHENEQLKLKKEEIKALIEKRDKIFQDELQKQDREKVERESKIDGQIKNIELNLGVQDNIEEVMAKIKGEEDLVEQHLNPYLQKTEEFQEIIQQTNQQFDVYKKEMQRLMLEKNKIESTTMQLHRKCEKSDLYIVDQVEEHLKLQEELEKQKEQTQTLQNLLSTLQSQLEH